MDLLHDVASLRQELRLAVQLQRILSREDMGSVIRNATRRLEPTDLWPQVSPLLRACEYFLPLHPWEGLGRALQAVEESCGQFEEEEPPWATAD